MSIEVILLLSPCIFFIAFTLKGVYHLVTMRALLAPPIIMDYTIGRKFVFKTRTYEKRDLILHVLSFICLYFYAVMGCFFTLFVGGNIERIIAAVLGMKSELVEYSLQLLYEYSVGVAVSYMILGRSLSLFLTEGVAKTIHIHLIVLPVISALYLPFIPIDELNIMVSKFLSSLLLNPILLIGGLLIILVMEVGIELSMLIGLERHCSLSTFKITQENTIEVVRGLSRSNIWSLIRNRLLEIRTLNTVKLVSHTCFEEVIDEIIRHEPRDFEIITDYSGFRKLMNFTRGTHSRVPVQVFIMNFIGNIRFLIINDNEVIIAHPFPKPLEGSNIFIYTKEPLIVHSLIRIFNSMRKASISRITINL